MSTPLYTSRMGSFDRWLQDEMHARSYRRQRDLALAAGVSRAAVTAWLAGRYLPDIASVLGLERALGKHRFVILDVIRHSLLDGSGRSSAIMAGSDAQDLIPLPRYRQGAPSTTVVADQPAVYLWESPLPVTEMQQYFAIECLSPDLAPHIGMGEIAIVLRGGQVLPGCFVCCEEDGLLQLRRVYRVGSMLLVGSQREGAVPLREAGVIGVVIEARPKPRPLYPPSDLTRFA